MSLSGDVVVDFREVEDSTMCELFKDKKSFVLTNVPRLSMTEVVEKVERLIGECGMRSRVYAKGRSAAVAGLAIPTIPTITVGAGAAAFIAGHTVATFNPDYEIGTNRTTGQLTITYTKWESVSAAADAVGDALGSAATKAGAEISAAASKAGEEISSLASKLKDKILR